ncbi:DNA polymerase III subunit [Lishizhenia sp.]|uniref:DNA polymerase III subunit n=1 Tax=Lishizhenia sp. TaxID=2497594 RepID=UPI00299D2185|nr:DNA polymerase III subunit [Lishizhenia sp.]MDX1444606.1 DNA polymerase III subunit [Lishizhenia sp.]
MQFKDVVGHKALKEHIINEVKEDRVSHAQLFFGKAGYGPLPMVLAFVQYMFCQNPTADDSCGICPSCRKVGKLEHPDLHFSFPTVQTLSKTSDGMLKEWRQQVIEQPYFNLYNWIERIDDKKRKPIIGVSESVEILRKLTLKSFEGGKKVMVIWMADEMHVSCSNKLLKIIEEPPKDTVFFLISESVENILPTINSRTQNVHIPRIDEDDLMRYLLQNRLTTEASVSSIGLRAEGNLIEAVDLSGAHEQKDVNREYFVSLMRVCYKKDVKSMLGWAEELAQLGRERQKNFLKYGLYMIRQSMMKNYTDDLLMRCSDEEADFLAKFARFITGNNVMDFCELFNDAHYNVERNANPKILFTNITFEIMRYIHRA